MCALTYRRIEEIQEIPILEEGSQPQPRTAVPQATPKGEYTVLAPLPRPRPLKPQNDDDDISHYSRVQIIDTSFQIQKAGESKIVAGIATLSVQDLDDLERLAAYLATVCGLPEEDCLVALKECETQPLAMRAEFEQSLANDAGGTADVFTNDESSLISRIRRCQSSVERPNFEGIISKTDEDEDEWKSRKQKNLEITLSEAQGSYAEPNELTKLSDILRMSMPASRQDATAPDPGPIAPPAKAANSTSKDEWDDFGNAIHVMRAAKRRELQKIDAVTFLTRIKEAFNELTELSVILRMSMPASRQDATAPDPGPIAPPAKAANSTSKDEWDNFGNAIHVMRAAKRRELQKIDSVTFLTRIKEAFNELTELSVIPRMSMPASR